VIQHKSANIMQIRGLTSEIMLSQNQAVSNDLTLRQVFWSAM
jgi:hypothetical protein